MSTHQEEDVIPLQSDGNSETPAAVTHENDTLIKMQIEEALVHKEWIDNPTQEAVSTRTLRGWRADLKYYDGEMKMYAKSEEAPAAPVLDALYNYALKGHALFNDASLKLINDEGAANSERQSCQKLYSEYKKLYMCWKDTTGGP